MKRMKKADLRKAVADGTVVAVVTAHKPQGEFVTSGKRATVIEVDIPRRVYTGVRSDFGGHIVNDGVRVRYEDGTEEVVSPHDVICSWTEYVVERDDMVAAHSERADALTERKRLATDAAEALGGRVESITDRKTFKTVDYRIVLTVEQATAAAEITA